MSGAPVCILRHGYFPEDAHVKKNVDALLEAGYSVDVICLRRKGEPARESIGGARVQRLPLEHHRGSAARYAIEYLLFSLSAFVVLALRALRCRYRLVEVYNLPDFLVFAALPAKLLGARVILYMFELGPEQAAEMLDNRDGHPLVRLWRWSERLSVRFSDQVITVSPYDQRQIEARDEPSRRPVVVLNSADPSIFKRVQPDASGCGFHVITHGAILRRYGIDSLIRAAALVWPEIPGLRVSVVGDGEQLPALRSLARDLGVSGLVHFSGWLSIEQVARRIAAADAGIVPAPVPWLLPNKLFEYVAMGCPVIAARSPSLCELFDDDCIAYFEPENAKELAERMRELSADAALGKKLAENASRAYESRRWEVMKSQYLALHHELLPDHRQLARAT